jgi:hypothetical protein
VPKGWLWHSGGDQTAVPVGVHEHALRVRVCVRANVHAGSCACVHTLCAWMSWRVSRDVYWRTLTHSRLKRSRIGAAPGEWWHTRSIAAAAARTRCSGDVPAALSSASRRRPTSAIVVRAIAGHSTGALNADQHFLSAQSHNNTHTSRLQTDIVWRSSHHRACLVCEGGCCGYDDGRRSRVGGNNGALDPTTTSLETEFSPTTV